MFQTTQESWVSKINHWSTGFWGDFQTKLHSLSGTQQLPLHGLEPKGWEKPRKGFCCPSLWANHPGQEHFRIDFPLVGGWAYPSEEYESQLAMIIPNISKKNVSNHQPVISFFYLLVDQLHSLSFITTIVPIILVTTRTTYYFIDC